MEKNFNFSDSSRSFVDYSNYYWFKDGFTTTELVDIESLTTNLDWVDAQTGQDVKSKITDYRKSKIKWCPQSDEWYWVYEKLSDMIKTANKTMWDFELTQMREQIQYTEYYSGGGQYDWHMDCGIGIQNQRKVSVTVQLSDPSEYEGGDLQFNIGGSWITAPRIKGAAVIFPSFFLHRVTPITKGTRKSFVLWVGGEPFK
jgi:PKHD-type hydroxylase